MKCSISDHLTIIAYGKAKTSSNVLFLNGRSFLHSKQQNLLHQSLLFSLMEAANQREPFPLLVYDSRLRTFLRGNILIAVN